MTRHLTPLFALLAAAALSAQPAGAGVLAARPQPSAIATEAGIAAVQQALDEQRYVDAGQMLDEALLAGIKEPRLVLLGGELNLGRGRFGQALSAFKTAEKTPALKARAMEGEGLALASLGRSDEAMRTLKAAIAEAPQAWRAWNALAAEYDHQGAWRDAEAAYAHALEGSDGAAIVFNNRGYSRILQRRLDDAVADLAKALQKKPGLVEAMTNLRLALALRGDYDRALAGSGQEDRAALLNNAGFAAGMRGDYDRAEDLLAQAMSQRGEYYDRAAQNLKLVKDLHAGGHAAR
jgi:Flp pilus assembly protein TadD